MQIPFEINSKNVLSLERTDEHQRKFSLIFKRLSCHFLVTSGGKKLQYHSNQRASKSREETAIATVGKLISILHLVAGPRTGNVMMTSQSKKNDFFSSGTNLQMSPL